MPRLKRYRINNLCAVFCASLLALTPLEAWAQAISADSGILRYGEVLWFAAALMIAVVWVQVLVAEYRHLCSRLDGGNQSVERDSEYREMLNVSPDAIMISVDDRLLYANPAALKMFRAATFGELAAHRPIDLVDPEYHGLFDHPAYPTRRRQDRYGSGLCACQLGRRSLQYGDSAGCDRTDQKRAGTQTERGTTPRSDRVQS